MPQNPGSMWRPVVVSLVALVIGLVGLGAFLAIYTRNSIDASDRKWCTTLTTLNDANKQAPPQGTYGVELAKDFRQLRGSFRCG